MQMMCTPGNTKQNSEWRRDPPGKQVKQIRPARGEPAPRSEPTMSPAIAPSARWFRGRSEPSSLAESSDEASGLAARRASRCEGRPAWVCWLTGEHRRRRRKRAATAAGSSGGKRRHRAVGQRPHCRPLQSWRKRPAGWRGACAALPSAPASP